MTTTTSHPPLTAFSDDEQLFRDAVAGFANDEVRPRVQAMERASKIDPDLFPKYFELGLMGIEVAEQYGGAGGTLAMVAIAVEEISKVDASAAIVCDVQNTLVNYPITRYGNDAQRAKYLPRLVGDTVGAYALSEPSSGSDAFALANPAAGYKGITAFIVEREFAGFSVGKKEDKLGIRASSTTELILDGCEVPEENVLGPVGQGYKIAIDTLNGGRVGIGAQMIGVAAGALDAALD